MANTSQVKEYNKKSILRLLYRKDNLSKKRIAKELNLSASVITKLCSELIQENLIVENNQIITGNKGRREIEININPNAKYCIGITIDHQKTVIVLTDLALNIIKTINLPILSDGHKHLDSIINSLNKLIVENNLSKTQFLGIGVSLKGFTDGERSINGIWNKPLKIREPLEEAMHIPVIMDNGIRCSALLEQLKFDENNFIFVKYMEPGIGATFLRNGELYRGESYFSMEIGHTIVDLNGDYCPLCHRKGCLERTISIEKMINEIKDNFSLQWCPELYYLCNGYSKNITLDLILKAADSGCIAINKLLKRNATYFAVAVINAHTMIDINKIIIISDLFSSERFSEYFKSAIFEYQLTPIYNNIQIHSHKNVILSPAALCISSFLLS